MNQITSRMISGFLLAVIVLVRPVFAVDEARVVARMDSPTLPRAARAVPLGSTLRIEGLPISADSSPDALELERVRVFAPGARIVVQGAEGETRVPIPANAYFRGSIDGSPESLAFLAVRADGSMRGIVSSNGDFWVLGDGPAPGLFVRGIDTATDFAGRGTGFACSNDLLRPFTVPARASGAAQNPPQTAAQVSATISYTATVAIETDHEFYNLFGNSADAIDYIGDLIGYSSGLYEAEVGTSLLVGDISLWATSSDPWQETSTVCGLFDFGRYWNDNKGATSRTIAHFLSGKELGGGVAWVGVLCESGFDYDHGGYCPSLTPQTDNYGGAYGFSASLEGDFDINNPSAVWDIVVVSHEIGHNFNSPHSHCYAGVGGNASPVDQCYSGQCGTSGCYCGGTSLPGAGAGTGTLMSYCHLLSGGLSNISLTFGLGHPYGVEPERIPDQMYSHVVAAAGEYPACLALIDNDLIFADGFQ